MTNAFACTKDEFRVEAAEQFFEEQHKVFALQRLRWAVVQLEGSDGIVYVQPETGNGIGSSEGCILFCMAYYKAVRDWRLATSSLGGVIKAKPPFAEEEGRGEFVEGGLHIYSDDILTRRVVVDGLASTAFGMVEEDAVEFDKAMENRGYKQNAEKRVLVPELRRSKETRKLQLLMGKDHGEISAHTRYLGGRYSRTDSNAPEVRRRLAAMSAAWVELGEFWHSRVPYRNKRAAFIGNVIGAGLSGMGSYRLLASECAELDKNMAKKLRSMMMGRAFDCVTNTKLTNSEVFAYWKVLPSRLEIAVRNLRWLQVMAMHPADCRQVVGTVFGKIFVGGKSFDNLKENGSLAEEASPFAKGFVEDVQLFGPMEGAKSFFVEWEKSEWSVRALFEDGEIKEAFAALDPTELRVNFWHRNVALWAREKNFRRTS